MARAFSVPIIGQSAASGAQVIDGSLKFDGNKQHYLTRNPFVFRQSQDVDLEQLGKGLEDTEGVRNQNLFSCNDQIVLINNCLDLKILIFFAFT